jgi:hypothetical protein
MELNKELSELKKKYSFSPNDKHLFFNLKAKVYDLKIAKEIVEFVKKFHNLESIRFCGNVWNSYSLSSEDLLNILKNFPNLKSLQIPLFSNESLEILKIILSMKHLERFGVENNCELNEEENVTLSKVLNNVKCFETMSNWKILKIVKLTKEIQLSTNSSIITIKIQEKVDFTFLNENKTIKKLKFFQPNVTFIASEDCIQFANSISKNSTIKELEIWNFSKSFENSKEIADALSQHKSIESILFSGISQILNFSRDFKRRDFKSVFI